MTLTELMQTIQRLIWDKLISLLEDDLSDKEINERAKELEEYIVLLLIKNKTVITTVINKRIGLAVQMITHQLLKEFGYQKDVDDKEIYQMVINSLNRNVMLHLASSEGPVSTYKDIAKGKREIDDIIGMGFLSAYIDKSGYRWSMDRVVFEEEKRIFREIYFNNQMKAFKEMGIELVKVDSFTKPRDACKKLQASGIICIVPRHEASEQAKQYPNIWDSEHMYGEAGGHHGLNCRHVWHSVSSDKVVEDDRMWAPVDKAKLVLDKGREERQRLKGA